MAKERYSDADLRLLTRAAEALKHVIDGDLGYRDLLMGKWLLMTRDVEHELVLRETERRTMFVSPLEQLLNLARWNERRGWGFSDDEIAAATEAIPPDPPAPADGKLQLTAVVLEINLPDGPDGMPGYRRTFDELWDIVVQEQGMRPCHILGLDPKVRLALKGNPAHAPGLRWRVIDFGHGWSPDPPKDPRAYGTAPRCLPPDAERPHAGILSAAAHFPLWLRRMDGKHVPYAWLSGYELPGMPHSIGAMRNPVVHHPVLAGDRDGKVFLYFHWDHVPFRDYAVPIYADPPPALPAREGDGEGG